METYETKKLEEYTKNARLYIILFKLSLKHIEYRNNRQEKNLSRLSQKLQVAKSYEEKLEIKNKILSALKKLNTHKKYIASSSIRDEIRNLIKGQEIELDYVGYSKNASKISEDPVSAAEFYSREYVECYRMIRILKKQLEEQDQVKKVKEEKRKNSKKEDKKPELFSSSELTVSKKQEQAIKNIQKLILESATRDNIYYGLTIDQERELREAFPSYTSYRDTRIIRDAIEMNQIYARNEKINPITKKNVAGKTPNIDEMLNLAIDCHNSLVFSLLHSEGFGSDIKTKISSLKLMGTLNMGRCLELYKRCYENFQIYYKKLSPEEKDKISEAIKKKIAYTKLFNIFSDSPRIITVNDLKRTANKTVADDIKRWSVITEENHMTYERNLNSATRLMTLEELVNLYKSISCEIKAYHNYNEAEDQREKEHQRKTLQLLQICFIEIIRGRLNYATRIDDPTLSDEEKKVELRKIEIQRAGICNDYFNEVPLFELRYIKYREIPKNETKIKGEVVEEADMAEERFYGLSKVKQTIARTNGSYAKLKRIREQEKVTQEDVEQIKRLF